MAKHFRRKTCSENKLKICKSKVHYEIKYKRLNYIIISPAAGRTKCKLKYYFTSFIASVRWSKLACEGIATGQFSLMNLSKSNLDIASRNRVNIGNRQETSSAGQYIDRVHIHNLISTTQY